MTTQKKVLFTALGIAVSLAALSLFAFAAFHSFDNIERNSMLRFLVDSEIRGIPLAENNDSLRFRSEPSDGNKPELNSATMTVSAPKTALKEIQDYLSGLGYTRQGDGKLFIKPSIEVRIDENSGGTITVTKLSWE
jgi:hypothetical protein